MRMLKYLLNVHIVLSHKVKKMCSYIHLNAIATLQPGQDIKANCSVSPSTLFTCGPPTDPTKHGNYAVYATGPTNLSLVMYSGSQYIHNNAGGVNQLDVSCRPPFAVANKIKLNNGAIVQCSTITPNCCYSLMDADKICKQQYGQEYGHENVSAAPYDTQDENEKIIPVCPMNMDAYQCWATIPSQASFSKC